MFAYCNNNPVTLSDESGKTAITLNRNLLMDDSDRGCGGGGGIVIIGFISWLIALLSDSTSKNGVQASTVPQNTSKELSQTYPLPNSGTIVSSNLALEEIGSQYGIGRCREAAEAMYKQDGGKGAIVRLDFPGRGYVVADNSRFGNKAISETGVHYGYKDKNEIVHCNVFPLGLPFQIWVNQFHDLTGQMPVVTIIPMPFR